MRLRIFLAFFILALCAIASPRASADEAKAKVQHAETLRGLAKVGMLRAARAREFRLERPTADAIEQGMGQPQKGAPLKVGFGRDVAELSTPAATSAAWDWEALPGGALVAAIRVTSESAASLRAALRVHRMPAEATVRFQAPGSSELFEVSGDAINEALARNAEAGDKGPDADLYWSPLIDGESIVIEVELPAGVDANGLRVSVPHVSHLVTSAAKDFVVTPKALSASCEIDAMCSVATWGSQMNAVARMIFSSGGGSFVCTGTLLADQDASSNIPYFLTANHCISSQSVASSLTTYWFYRSTSCNSSSVGPYQQLSGGGTLLYASTSTDTSFMQLNNTPPAGAVYAGWFAGATPSIGTSATGLHHPKGDWLKISNGAIDDYINCTAPDSSGSFSCSAASASTGRFYDVLWTSGGTEPGSSGSGLFRSDGLLIGQLYGGSGTCSAPGDDIYGRFDVAYNASLKNWLSSAQATASLTVSRSGAGQGTVTSSPAGINCGSTCVAAFPSNSSVTLAASAVAGSVFAGWSGACAGTGSCVVDMSGAKSVTATFNRATVTLTVTPTGNGTITSSPAGINCPGTCTAPFTQFTSVTLNASPAAGQAFKGWAGACTGNGSCVIAMDQPTDVWASFGLKSSSAVSVTSSTNPTYYGQSFTLDAAVTGNAGAASGLASFTLDGQPLAGCASVSVFSGHALCTVTSSSAVGTHAIVASFLGDPNYLPSTSAPFTQTVVPLDVNLKNLSTRGQVLSGDDVMIGGFVISGSVAKTVVIRALGPSLANYGVSNALANPSLRLVRSSDGTTVTMNDDWQQAANAADLNATGLAPANPLESAMLVNLPAGAYTVIVSGVNGSTGIGLVEVYEIDHPEARLVNLSTRGQVSPLGTDNVMIGGFIVQGNGPQKLVIRALGPSLAAYGIANPLSDPALKLVRISDGVTMATNDNWRSAPGSSEIQSLGLAPSNDLESAMVMTLTPGAYTAIVSTSGRASGTAIVEVYAVQ